MFVRAPPFGVSPGGVCLVFGEVSVGFDVTLQYYRAYKSQLHLI
jgi:hypothetical protein